MNGIIDMTDLTLDTPLTDWQKTYLGYVQNSAHTLLDILNDILDIAKIDDGKLRLLKQVFNLHALLTELETTYMPLTNEKELDFSIHTSLHDIMLDF